MLDRDPDYAGLIAVRPGLRRVARVAAWGSVAALVVLSWTPRDILPRTGAPGVLEHVFAYAMSSVCAALGDSPRRKSWFGLAYVALAALLEVGQIWVPGRVAQFIDFAASSAGAVVGLAAVSLWMSATLGRHAGFGSMHDSAARVLLLGLIALGVVVTPIWIGFLIWLVGLGLGWLIS